MIFPEQPVLSALALVLLALLLLYVARLPVHRLVRRLARLVTALLRIQGRSLAVLAERVRERNREVLLELGRARSEHRLERDFHRVGRIVERDLARFPELQQSIGRHVSQLEDDYYRTAETPPPAPDWLDAIDRVVRLRETQTGNPVVSRVLEDLESKLHRQHQQSLDGYRKGMRQRHRLLHAMMPQWRRLNHTVEDVGNGIRNLLTQADQIDQHQHQFQTLNSVSDRAEQKLKMSIWTQFVFVSLAMVVWAAVAWLNVELVRPALAGSLTTAPVAGGLTLVDLTAWTLVLLIVGLGLLLLEVLGVTRLFDGLRGLDERRRGILFWSVVAVLILVALSQSGLLYWRERLLDHPALYQRLISYPVVVLQSPTLDAGLPLVARMLLGPAFTFVLLFTPVPLLRWLESGRVLLGDCLAWVLALLGLLLRLLAALVHHGLTLLLAGYDLLICLPLWLEGLWTARRPRPDSRRQRDANGRFAAGADHK